MDQPYNPPTSRPPDQGEPKSGNGKIRRAALILSCGAIVVGSGLFYFIARRWGLNEFAPEETLRGLPWLLRETMQSKPSAPLLVGIAFALFSILFALTPLTRLGLIFGMLAVGTIGTWAAALFWVLMKVVGAMGG